MRIILFFSLVLFTFSCSGGKGVKKDNYKIPDRYNLKIVIFNGDVINPADDNRCYYRIYIDKVERGRTSTGLESQEKIFETKLRGKRHLFSIEKWILDEKKGRYIKVNNVRQPKPSFYYFTMPENHVLKVTGRTTKGNKVEYSESLERK